MTEKMNKIQIRAEVFSAINSVFSQNESAENALNAAVNKLNGIEDKDFLSRLLIKEFISTEDSERSALISLLLLNCIPVENLETNLWSNLALKTVSDKKKYQLIDILRAMGKFIEYDNYLDYFEEPQNVIDMDTHKLLTSAMLNPEAQIDFLDFLSTLNNSDKNLLITSIGEDYPPDDLANILSPIVLFEKDKDLLTLVINLLVKSLSPLAYYSVSSLSELTNDEYTKKLTQKALKELKFAGITQDKADNYYKDKFSNSILYNCYSSLVDGRGNQGMLFSRIRSDNSIQLFCVVINDINGIIDCFGFNSISQTEFTMMLDKFFDQNTKISITFETALSWLNEAEKISFKKDNILPYEYICWKEILFDVPVTNNTSDEMLSVALKMLPDTEFEFDELFENTYLDNLYFTKEDNVDFNKFVSEFDDYIFEKGFDIKNAEEKIISAVKEIFEEQTKDILRKRLIKIAFCLMSNSKLKDASKIYYLTMQNDYTEKFYIEILKKSIFEFYKDSYIKKMNSNSENIFLQHSKKDISKLDAQNISKILKVILEAWGRDE